MTKPNSKKSADYKKALAPSRTTLCCNLPIIPDRYLNNTIDPNREFLIRYIEKNG